MKQNYAIVAVALSLALSGCGYADPSEPQETVRPVEIVRAPTPAPAVESRKWWFPEEEAPFALPAIGSPAYSIHIAGPAQETCNHLSRTIKGDWRAFITDCMVRMREVCSKRYVARGRC